MASDNRRVYAVDPWHWDSPDYGCHRDTTASFIRSRGGGVALFKEFCHTAGDKLFKSIFPIRAYSVEAAMIFPFRVDMIFFDGEHTYSALSADLKAWRRHFRPDTLLVFDDYSNHFDDGGLKRAVDEFVGPNLKSFHPLAEQNGGNPAGIVHCLYKDTIAFPS